MCCFIIILVFLNWVELKLIAALQKYIFKNAWQTVFEVCFKFQKLATVEHQFNKVGRDRETNLLHCISKTLNGYNEFVEIQPKCVLGLISISMYG